MLLEHSLDAGAEPVFIPAPHQLTQIPTNGHANGAQCRQTTALAVLKVPVAQNSCYFAFVSLPRNFCFPFSLFCWFVWPRNKAWLELSVVCCYCCTQTQLIRKHKGARISHWASGERRCCANTHVDWVQTLSNDAMQIEPIKLDDKWLIYSVKVTRIERGGFINNTRTWTWLPRWLANTGRYITFNHTAKKWSV